MKTILSPEQVYGLISDNKYALKPEGADLSATSYPASASEELQVITRTAEEYGFEINDSKSIGEMLAASFSEKAAPRAYEGAVLFVTGQYSVQSSYNLSIGTSSLPLNVFVYHKDVVDAFHKSFAGELVGKKLITLYEGLDREYLYQVISTTFESMLFERLKEAAHKLPIYEVTFAQDSTFIIEETGEVI